MRGVLIGVCAGTAVVALGLGIIWIFRGVFPIWVVLVAVLFLLGRPVLDWLEWRARTCERDRQNEE